VLFIRRPGSPFANAMHQHFRMPDSPASGEPRTAFLHRHGRPASTSWSSVWTLRSSTPFISTNSGTVFSADVADHAAGMLVDVLRRGDYALGSKVSSSDLVLTQLNQ
jgi:hydroxypyruvate reductase 2